MKIIAFYLPQYHPTEHNNQWWGKGFTEWTNVAKAKKLFRNHYQPRVPADLGFYDLRLPEVREQQVDLARVAGVTSFCYYHYWFGNGNVELERPLNDVVDSGTPDFPFCLCWANETWGAKMWNHDGTIAKRIVLAEQTYPGKEDNEAHFYYLLKAFQDSRYDKVDGKLLFVIYRPLAFEGLREFMQQWNQLAVQNGLPGFFFVGYSLNIEEEHDQLMELGLDAIISCGMSNVFKRKSIRGRLIKLRAHMNRTLLNRPTVIPYKKAMDFFLSSLDSASNIFPTMIPNWDHTPRSGRGGFLFQNATPELFQIHAKQVLSVVREKEECRQVVFLKSWNEWGEGNYMEPDLKYGHGYIKALNEAIQA